MPCSRGPAALEVVMECHFSFDPQLIGTYTPLEEVCKLLPVLVSMNPREFFERTPARCRVFPGGDPRRIASIPPHVRFGKPTPPDSETSSANAISHSTASSIMAGYTRCSCSRQTSRLLFSLRWSLTSRHTECGHSRRGKTQLVPRHPCTTHATGEITMQGCKRITFDAAGNR